MTQPPMYPEGLEVMQMLKMLLSSCEALQHRMGGTEATKNCTGLITSWDNREPTIFYLERNMQWAREVLERKE